MPVSLEALGIDRLSVSERLELIELIWDSLPEQVTPMEIPDWHKEVLAKRIADADANPGAVVPWREVLERLKNKS